MAVGFIGSSVDVDLPSYRRLGAVIRIALAPRTPVLQSRPPMVLARVVDPRPEEIDLSIVYDAIVVGSGAAGGMASHALTARGLRVLMLEAGKQLDLDEELK